MRELVSEVLTSLRRWRREPLLLAVVLAVLAVGIGASTAIFSVVDRVVFQPLPYPAADRLVALWETEEEGGASRTPVAPADYFDWRQQARGFAALGAYHRWSFTVLGEGDPERIEGAVADAALFEVLGVDPALGRAFLPEEAQPGGEALIILGDGLWRRRFGADPAVIGTTLTVDEETARVVGVMPPGFAVPGEQVEMWRVLRLSPASAPRDFQFLQVVGRLPPGIWVREARVEMQAIAGRLAAEYPDTNRGRGVTLLPLHEQVVGEVRASMLLLLGAVLLVLAIVWVNLANVLLARGISRRREMAVRMALGAGRPRLAGLSLVEPLVLAAVGGAGGLLLAVWCQRLLVRLGGSQIPRLQQARLDGDALIFALGATLLTGIGLGLGLMLHWSRLGVERELRQGGGGSGRLRGRTRAVLVTAQIALAAALAVGAGLLVKSFLRLRAVEPGFRPDHLLTLHVTLPPGRYPESLQATAFFTEVCEGIEALPGVEGAATALSLPLARGFRGMRATVDFTLDEPIAEAMQKEKSALLRPVSLGYFKTLGIGLVAGRTFRRRDDARAPPVAVVNETMARRLFPAGTPVGQRLTTKIQLGRVGSLEQASREIVGVVRDVRFAGLAADTAPEIYVPLAQGTWRMMNLVVRTSVPPLTLADAVRAQVWEVDRNLPVSDVVPMEDLLSDSLRHPRLSALFLSIFSVLALALATLGVFGVVSYAVDQRRWELGVRMVCGAGRRRVVTLVFREGLLLTLGGLAIGLLAAWSLRRFLAEVLFGVTPADPAVFAGAALVLAAAALLASYLPARRAARIDPAEVLR
jgi:putative ABC transport system permease protein